MSDAPARLARARAAQGQWAQLTVRERARALRPLRCGIAERIDEIVAAIADDMGKPPMDALAGDAMVTLEQLRFYERRAADVLRPVRRGKPAFFYGGARFVEVQEPHGAVLVCAPWNYPLQLAVVPMATALFAGNAVLLKCSEHAPRTARLIAELCVAAGLPEGLVQVSWGGPDEAAELLDARPDFVFFTGSSANGRAVASKAAGLMIPAAMELGGKDAALVFDSCDVERAANGVAYASFANAGQGCVSAKRIYVQRGVYEDFLRAFLERVERLRVGTTVESDLGPVRIEAVRSRFREQVADALAGRATLRAGSAEDATPVVLTDVPADAALLREESFGPVVCIAPFESEADAIALANASEFLLSASVWTGNEAQGERVAMQLQCGSCAVNDAIRNIGNPETAFGGNKMSGYGRYHGAEGLRTFSRTKSVMTAGRLKRTEIHWFPFSARTYAQLRGLLQMRHLDGVRRRWKAFRGMWVLPVLLACCVCAGAADLAAAQEGPLTVEVSLPAHARGQIGYLIFAGAEGFPNDRERALRRGFVPVGSAETQRIDVGALPPGRYAVSVYLDENGNRKLDTNWLGMPKEAVGVSNNPRGRMGPPRFEDSAFVHNSSAETISIKLVRCCKP